MLKNHLKVALRTIKKYWSYSAINMAGLVIGMACSILILLWIQDELNYDRFHENGKNLYLVGNHMYFGNDVQHWGSSPPALGPALKTEYPDIVNSARLTGNMNLLLRYEDNTFNEYVRAADPALLEMFTFPLVLGDSKDALSDKHSIVITEHIADKYFGDEDPLGKMLRVNDEYDFVVTGVLEDIPTNSYIQFDFLVPIEFVEELHQNDQYLDIWDNYSFRTFVQLKDGVPIASVTEKIAGRVTKAKGVRFSESFLQPYTRVRLHWLGYGGGSIQQVRAFAMIAFFVLFIACVNFMNLTTAQSTHRTKEIGLRKVVGARKGNLIKQFYSESILMAFLSFVLAMALVYTLIPVFNTFSGKTVALNFSENPSLIPSLIGVVLFTGLLAGSYPALFMASLQPHKILKGSLQSGSKNSRFRKVLVVLQFTLSIALIAGTGIISQQLRFMQDKDLGFEKEHLLYMPLDGSLEQNWRPAKQALLQNPNILSVSMISQLPTGIWNNNAGWSWEGKDSETDPLISKIYTDFDLLETFQMKMIKGSYYSKELISGPTMSGSKIIINETLANMIGLEDPIGARLSNWDEHYTIMGVVKDFHFKPLYQEIEPMAVYYDPEQAGYMCMRIHADRIAQTMAHIENVHQQFNPAFPFVYRFLDDDFDQLYRAEQRQGTLIQTFTLVAILISCLGLFGLAAYMAERRTKEIGIRKVLGASIPGLVLLLSKEFTKWVVLANIFAWPLAYFIMNNWLENFAYRIDLGLGTFILAAGLALGIASFTVSVQAIRAAQSSPVKALKYE